MKTRRSLGNWIRIIALSCLTAAAAVTDALKPRPPVPTPQQIAWQKCETNLFLHFGMNTFTDREWGVGNEDPGIFNPTRLDARQWVRAAKAGGFKIVILTAKHHDGFCLWPSKYTAHSVKSSPWHGGNGDVVRDLADACRAESVKLGLYLSPWDRHEPSYGDSPRYNDFYVNQLTELLTGYGPIAEVWFDGACGEGPNGKKQEYDWERIRSTVRRLQPDAIMFSDAGPDVRWIGNEKGIAGDPCWSPIDSRSVPYPGAPGDAVIMALQHGDPFGDVWRPGESDVSIRPGWFWHKKENDKVRSVENLVDLYFKSVGRNSLLLLNVPPNGQGLLDQTDVNRLVEFRARLNRIFKTNLLSDKATTASNVRGGAPMFEANNATDKDPDTYWATDEGLSTGWIEVDMVEPATFNILNLQEPIALGQRVESYRLDYLDGQSWKRIVSGTTIGYRRLDRFNNVTARRIRLSIDKSISPPALSHFGLYFAN